MLRGSTYPAVGFGLLSQVGQFGNSLFISCQIIALFGKIGIFDIFPAILELFECSAAAFGEAGIAYLPSEVSTCPRVAAIAWRTISVEARVIP